MRSFVWTALQTWGSRAISMLTFLGLARLLTPTDFGLASLAILVFSVVSLVSDLGIGDALIRDRRLQSSDFNVPFAITLSMSVLMAGCVASLSTPIAEFLGAADRASFIVATCFLVPVATAANFQEAMMKRELRFRLLAMRALVSGLIGGAVGVFVAFAGGGAWALIAQFATQVVVGAIWLWARPIWRPDLNFTTTALRSIGAFSINLVGMRLVDFATMRTVDTLVLTQLGASAFGLFAVSTRLYQFLMQLFQASVHNVGLAMVSRIIEDRERLRRVFVRTFSLSAMLGSPPFFLLAALAHEFSSVMFGPQWTGADQVMTPFMLVGGIHCVQFGAGSFLIALGRSDVLLRLMLLKAGFVLLPLFFFRAETPAGMAQLIAAGLLMETPFTVRAALVNLSLPWSSLLRPVAVPLLASVCASVSAHELADQMPDAGGPLTRIIGGTIGFGIVYGGVVMTLARDAARSNILYLRDALKRS